MTNKLNTLSDWPKTYHLGLSVLIQFIGYIAFGLGSLFVKPDWIFYLAVFSVHLYGLVYATSSLVALNSKNLKTREAYPILIRIVFSLCSIVIICYDVVILFNLLIK